MGWNSGADIFECVARELNRLPIEDHLQANILIPLVKELEANDCDVLDESFGTTRAGDMALIECGYHSIRKSCEEVLFKDDTYGCTCGWRE